MEEGKFREAAERRAALIASHVCPNTSSEDGGQTLLLSPCMQEDGSSRAGPPTTSSFPTASGQPSKYTLVHGDVSKAPVIWRAVTGSQEFTDILYEKAVGEPIAKITINRPERRNAFRPETVKELQAAFSDARDDPNVGAIIFTGKGDLAFCSGGDQAVRGHGGYVGGDSVPRLNVLDLQIQIRRLPKPVIAMVAGYAVGGGHVLHMICDITIAADNAVFGQTGPKVGSFDAGYGSSMMARLLAQLEAETVKWCREINRNSPTALRLLKSALNATEDGHAGLQELAGNATLLFYQTEEGSEGREAYMEGRKPDFSKFKRLP
eukprot:TRINITY_DN6160_c0_g2_i1.p1 TRINITY_DN6160_c0_g2~~TRINITY_DN6160_c0_g2_i1.p1  ORF type:complete len:321 (-),score=77.62 TRINITY_DN6160_c0_g2_i1:39-1001(-)